MNILGLILVLLIVGIALKMFHVDGMIRNLIIFICIVAVLYVLLGFAGIRIW